MTEREHVEALANFGARTTATISAAPLRRHFRILRPRHVEALRLLPT